MNVRLLRRIAKLIQEKPKEFDMEFLHAAKGRDGSIEYDDCGTMHCICGWGAVLTGKDHLGVGVAARRVFRIALDNQRRLFFAANWPPQYRDRYLGYKTQKARAKVAAARIEHFIKTKGAE